MVFILIVMIATASLAAFSTPVRAGTDDTPPLTMRTPPTPKPKPTAQPAVLRLADKPSSSPSTAPASPFQANLPRGSVLNVKV
ncbi:MAG TPA: hypothetical protein PK677_06550 [Acidiphilium sp.]|nr:MAG: hypothetical protein B7Z67_08785 [Acidiphilium sp. 21-60-14]OYV89893.1 MAG: hypothetical protein B7Z57_10870 [Acidiphilium sp. 37-60-79]OZB39462.1 MAG: hypothetical protein B7X48_09170 [Acidiphilium sp. 34-60-192]HQT88199.1 hypothetical protein [Acidiphilium sp.]HQU23405.1 hypothetical protein [Acidiphilium sp.]